MFRLAANTTANTTGLSQSSSRLRHGSGTARAVRCDTFWLEEPGSSRCTATSFAAFVTATVLLLLAGRSVAQVAQPHASLDLAAERIAVTNLIDIESLSAWKFQTPSGVRVVDGRNIVRYQNWHPPRNSSAVWLSDGSWLAGNLTWVDASTIRVDNDWLEPVSLSLDELRAILLTPPLSHKAWSVLEQKLLDASGSSDVVWRTNGEQISGLVRATVRKPSIAEESREQVRWSVEPQSGKPIELGSDELRAVVFSPVLRPAMVQSTGSLDVGLRDGSLLRVVDVQPTTSGRLELRLGDGRALHSLDMPPQFATSVQYLSGKPDNVTWLSSLEPARYRHADPLSSVKWPLGVNQNLFGKPLLIRDQIATHSLTLHAPAQVTYRHDGRAARLLAEVCVDPPASGEERPLGSAQFKVLVARAAKLTEEFASDTLRAAHAPLTISVDVTGAQLIVLVVEEADLGSLGDHCVWRDVRLAYPSN